jgi:hypothetical protein
MYKVKYGGKKGKTIQLVESPDLVAIRTKKNHKFEDLDMTTRSKDVMEGNTEVASFPEADVTVRRVAQAHDEQGLEAAVSTTARRDQARAALKQESEIRFAGRVLQDAETGEVMLYTENFFVKFKGAIPEKDCLAILEKYHLNVKDKLSFAENAYFVSAKEGTGLEVFAIADHLLKEKQVEYCHPELVQERRFKSPAHPLQWHLDKTRISGKEVDNHVNIRKAWMVTRGEGITVAIIDDGVDINHPEFSGRIMHPYDATEGNEDPRPKLEDDTHGTPCAGIACAAGLKDGASGTAPESSLMPIRLRSGLGSIAEANAFVWAADHGADVISCSWGPSDGDWWKPDDPLHLRSTALPDSTRLAMEYALKKGRGGKGCVILFAAGNGREEVMNDGYCSYKGVIAVAACNDSGKRSVYSDFGDAVWTCFPSNDFEWEDFKHPAPLSEGLRTTDRLGKPGYAESDYTNAFGGTSGACPGVAGVVALVLAANPSYTQKQIKQLIRRSCQKIDPEGGKYNEKGHSPYYGYGRIDAGKAVAGARRAAKRKSQVVNRKS